MPVIVKVDPAERNKVRKALKDLGFKVKREHGGISAFTFDAPVGMLDRIAAIPGVLGVSIDAEIGGDLLGIVATVPNTSGAVAARHPRPEQRQRRPARASRWR